MNSCENTTESTDSSKKTSNQAYSLSELTAEFNKAKPSDLLNKIPAWKAYQAECLKGLEAELDSYKAAQKRREAEVFVGWEAHFEKGKKPTGEERKQMSKLIAAEEYDEDINQVMLKINLAESGYEYLKDKFIGACKMFGKDLDELKSS